LGFRSKSKIVPCKFAGNRENPNTLKPFQLVFPLHTKIQISIIPHHAEHAAPGRGPAINSLDRQNPDRIGHLNNPPGQDVLPFITRLGLLALLVYLARAGLQFLRSYMAHVAGWGVVADVRKHIYEHMQRLSLRFYEDKQTGQLMSRVINDTDLFEAVDRSRCSGCVC
jgi:ABC-type multidrug transport system fused ATPase/permease subunit